MMIIRVNPLENFATKGTCLIISGVGGTTNEWKKKSRQKRLGRINWLNRMSESKLKGKQKIRISPPCLSKTISFSSHFTRSTISRATKRARVDCEERKMWKGKSTKSGSVFALTFRHCSTWNSPPTILSADANHVNRIQYQITSSLFGRCYYGNLSWKKQLNWKSFPPFWPTRPLYLH